MPFLDWVKKSQSTQSSQQVPYRQLRAVSAHGDVDGPNADNLMAIVAVNQCLETSQPPLTVTELYEALDCSFRFDPGIYPARNVYRGGSYRFTKHFYGSHLIHDLQERTPGGELSEEFLCARAIDTCAEVKHWVRNIERQEKASFWLPTSTDYFYPDFVAELHDGRVLVIEYKRENLWDTEDSREKRVIGAQWEENYLEGIFLMVRKNMANDHKLTTQLCNKPRKVQQN